MTKTWDIPALLALHRSTFGDLRMEADGDAVPADTPPVDAPKTFTQDEVNAILAREKRAAKPADYDDLKAAAKKLADIEAANASDLEKAVKAAREEGESNGRKAGGQRLARAEFVAAAAKRNAEYDATSILDDLNLAKYVGDDGEPNTDEITAAVERLIPTAVAGPDPIPPFDGGVRRTAPPSDPRLADLAQIEADLKARRK